MAYRVVKSGRMTPYQAQYFWHVMNRQGRDASSGGLRPVGRICRSLWRVVLSVQIVAYSVAAFVCLILFVAAAWLAVEVMLVVLG